MKPVKMRQIASNCKLKYKNHLGIFSSKEEADRYEVLLEMQKRGLISDLRHRVSFTLLDSVKVNKYQRVVMKTKTKTVKKKVCAESPVALEVSFVYKNKKGYLRVEVVKSEREYKDPAYIIKRKLMRYLHNIIIVEN